MDHWLDEVAKYEKYIALTILINIVITCFNGFYYFYVMDNYLEEKYKETYTIWREDKQQAIKELKLEKIYKNEDERQAMQNVREAFNL